MSYFLRDGLSFCDVGGRYIFLDIAADRYFVLGARDNATLLSLLGNQSAGVPLCGLGPIASLLSNADGSPLGPTSIHRASISVIEWPGQPTGSQYPFILYALARARRDVRRKPLSHLLRDDALPSPSQNSNDEWLGRIALSFERVATRLGREKNCLPRSLALWRFLRQRGHHAQIIFGVKDLPFAAHCWVQSGPLLLNDRLETIQPFTPVLAR